MLRLVESAPRGLVDRRRQIGFGSLVPLQMLLIVGIVRIENGREAHLTTPDQYELVPALKRQSSVRNAGPGW
jgi:hypothetical protein